MAKVRVFNPAYTPRSYFAGGEGGKEGGKSNMARHHHHRRHHHRRNPFGVSGGLLKDVAFQAAGLAGANYISSFLGQSGWIDVLATFASAWAASYAGKAIGGASAGDEVFKGGVLAALIKAVKTTGVSVPGLSGMGLYVPNYFSAPTASDVYGRAAAPVAILPPAPSGGGGKGMGYSRYRSRFLTRF